MSNAKLTNISAKDATNINIDTLINSFSGGVLIE
jgi:hypothetical protein